VTVTAFFLAFRSLKYLLIAFARSNPSKYNKKEAKKLINHFQFQPLFQNSQLPGWKFSFFFKKQQFSGIYNQTGKIEWTSTAPASEDQEMLISQIHELMLFHVYDN
jgi:hypothetical protein